jgi:FkbM family methyltransferase
MSVANLRLEISWGLGHPLLMNRSIIKIAKPFVERIPPIAGAYRNIRVRAKLKRHPVQTPLGFLLVGNRSMEEGAFEPQETRLIESILPLVEYVVDVGANIGYYVCLARSRSKHVIAFEPIALNVQLLLRNIEVNGWKDGLEIYPLAVSNRCGIARMLGGGTGASLVAGWAGVSESYSSYLPVTTLDSTLNGRLHGKRSLFIIDVEGAEADVLAGAVAQLALAPKPLWMVEIIFSQRGGIGKNPNFRHSFEAFWRNGYECWTANDDRRPVSAEMIRDIEENGVDTLNCTNFLFAEKASGDLFK